MRATLCSPLPEDGDSGTAGCWMLSDVSDTDVADGMRATLCSPLPGGW